jgi:CrcB protein
MSSARDIAAVFAGGGVGAVARYIVGLIVLQRAGPGFPYGTLLINVAGCFAIGIVAGLAQSRAIGLEPSVRLFLTVGVLGGFTTFSTFAYDAVTLAGEGAIGIGALYVVLSVGFGVIATLAGTLAARVFG